MDTAAADSETITSASASLTHETLDQVDQTLKELKDQHAEKLLMKENLRKKSEEMEIKLDRADKLVTGLAGERIRWEKTVAVRNITPLLPPHTQENWTQTVSKTHK